MAGNKKMRNLFFLTQMNGDHQTDSCAPLIGRVNGMV